MIPSDFSTVQTVINGNLDSTNLSATAAQSAGINQSGQTVKGSSIVATLQNTTSATFTTLPTPDQVTGIVLPTPGLISVWYQATWSESVSSASQAAIFLNSNQLVRAAVSGAPVAVSTGNGGTSNNVSLVSSTIGLASFAASAGYAGDVSTGQVIGNSTSGGPCWIFAAAGTYTVSIQFKTSSGNVNAQNRRLYVQALSFA